MISFKSTLLKFGNQGEKTGWTYIHIPARIAGKLKPGCKKSFRVKGKIDEYAFKAVSLLPMGDGDFIMAVNATMRKTLRKQRGDAVNLEIEADLAEPKLSAQLMTCLRDEPEAMAYFKKLPGSHQKYYSNWIESAKTEPTKTKRIALAINSFVQKMSFAEMIKAQKKQF